MLYDSPMPLAFTGLDWGIVGVYMLIATIPGFLCRKYVHGQSDFLVAGRTLSVWLATATLTATEMGLITVMYMAEMGYKSGFSAMVIGVIAGLATLFVGLTGFMVSGLRASGAATVAEYYQMRYSRGVRLLGGLIIATAGILNYGVFLQIEAKFVALITQIPDFQILPLVEGAQPVHVSGIIAVMTVLVSLVLLYTLIGGMVSVVLTDYIQFIVLTIGMAATTWWMLTRPEVGGLEGLIRTVGQERPEYGFNPFSVAGGLGIGWVWIIWQCMHWIGTNTWQTQAFRTAATDSPRTAKLMWTLTAFNYFGRAVIPMLWGVGAIAFLSATMSREQLAGVSTVEAMPLFLKSLPPGLVGLLVAGMLAALMSTHSSYLLAWSGVIAEDLVNPLWKIATGRELRISTRIWITRFFILCLAGFLMAYGLWFKVESTVWGYLSMTGTMYVSGAAALVALGLYWRRANTTGAYLGLLGGALPGLVYMVLRITTLLVEKGQLSATAGLIPSMLRAGEWLTDAMTGLISFPLAMLGMVLGSLLSGRREAVEESIPAVPAAVEGE